ncbi:MAG: hypothetical protein JW744_00820 [Candidatus Diapherotrites archaeon]|uniref:Uncharacterized protein n=1 Tax=Candidatus Iainarchaeum sp. TaxID=3101447 RepID=A0A939C8J3_9ARCH|nr:hypothetical protein [Candidatus Diapherotrites archaeon]
MDRKPMIAGLVLLGLAALFTYAYNQGSLTGFFGVAVEPVGLEEVSPVLSFTVLKQTTLEASLNNSALKECPQETVVQVLVRNTGESPAEKLFLNFGPGIRVVGCSNCRLDLVEPSEQALISAVLCIESEQTNSLVVGSANSNRIELQLE